MVGIWATGGGLTAQTRGVDMAELNTSILLNQVQPKSPFEQFAALEQIRGLRDQGQLRGMQMQQMQEDRARQQKLRELLGQGLQGEELANAMQGAGFLTEANAQRKTIADQQTARIDREKKAVELQGELAKFVMANPTEQSAIGAIARMEQALGTTLDNDRAAVYSMRNDPAALRKWAGGYALKAEQMLPKFERFDTGGQVQMGTVSPFGEYEQSGAIDKTVTPDAVMADKRAREEGEANRRLTKRGQDLANERALEKNKNDADAVGKVEWKQGVDGEWVALPKEVRGPGPVTPITTTVLGKRESQSKNALGIIKEANKLIDKGTSSYIGAGVDQVFRAFGGSTEGADVAAQLKALEGALMMAQPRMEGPQSDKDVALYRQMAAQIGDPTVPASQKKSALKAVERLHKRYAPEEGPAFDERRVRDVPDPSSVPIGTEFDRDGVTYRSDGKSWQRKK